MIATRAWNLAEGEWAEVLRALRFDHFKWDTWACGRCLVLPEALEVPPETHDRVVRAAEGLHRALGRFEERVRRDPEALTRLGIPRPLHPLIAGEEDHGLQCARYDFFPTPDGRLMVSEFNEDVPGGFNETVGLPELLGDPGTGSRWEAGLRNALAAALSPWERIALLYATAFSEDLQHMLILERWLQEAGHHVVLASPDHLRAPRPLLGRRHRILGEPVDAAFRFYPGEWMPRLPNFPLWLRLRGALPMMNPVFRLVRQSKMMFALWWEDTTLEPEDRALLEAHCPRTERFTAAWIERLRDEPHRWVLKRAFGRMGDSVVMGNLATPREWEDALGAALRHPDEWCVQERFTVREYPFRDGALYPTLGAFLVNGRFAGYYSRAAPRPFLTHEAFHVATLVRTS
jgi:glutathionylspermidine synthase